MTGFEQKSQQYKAEMQQTHEQQLNTLRKNLEDQLENKPKKWSKDLIVCRRSLENIAKQKLYLEAQQIKKVTEALHKKEENDMNSKFDSVLHTKVRNLQKKQQAETAALMKKIETKRREVDKKRQCDTAKLVQRNRSIVKMIDTKNKLECSKVASDIQSRIKRVLNQR